MEEVMLEDILKSYAVHEKSNTNLPQNIEDHTFLLELAYHEASHFVFSSMMETLNLGFQKIKGVEISITSLDGRVNGFAPIMSNDKLLHNAYLKPFYIADKKRLAGRLLGTLAGFTSYKKFICNTDRFISIVHKESRTVRYMNQKEVSTSWKGFDFTVFKNYLSFINLGDRVNYLSMVEYVTNQILQIMDIRAVQQSIQFIKNRLIENEGKFVQGDLLRNWVKEVQQLTVNVNYKGFLLCLIKEIERRTNN